MADRVETPQERVYRLTTEFLESPLTRRSHLEQIRDAMIAIIDDDEYQKARNTFQERIQPLVDQMGRIIDER